MLVLEIITISHFLSAGIKSGFLTEGLLKYGLSIALESFITLDLILF